MKKLSYLNLFWILILISNLALAAGAGAGAGAKSSAKTKPSKTFKFKKFDNNANGRYGANNGYGNIKGLHIVTSKYGENHKVPIARNFPNIIKTPFIKSNALGLNKNYEFQYHGAFLIITPKDNKPIWISIIDEANLNTTPISLTLIPKKNLDSQTILVSTKNTSSLLINKQTGEGFPQQITNLFKKIIQHKVPNEYSISPLTGTFTVDNKLLIKKLEKYTGAEFDIYRWKITNKSKTAITLTEDMFQKNPNFVALTFYPKTLLKPGKTTNVLIMIGKGI